MSKIRLKKLEDQVIVITGATSGIGLVTARMAAEKGAKVVLVARNEEALKELVEELQEKGHSAMYVKADVGIEEDVYQIADTAIQEYGRFDTWVNNAGVSIYGHAMDVPVQDMKRLFDTNYWGTVYGSRVAIKHYKVRGEPGALINIGSLNGDFGTLIQSTYSPSKFAVHGWTESLRMEVQKAKLPVSITLIHPARVDTPYPEHAKSYLDQHPIHKGMLYPPHAVAEAILYASEHPKRDIYVGFQAKVVALMGRNFPCLTDKLMERIIPPSSYIDKPSNSPTESNLYKAGHDLQERGSNMGWKRSGSFYVKATKHPILTTLSFVSMGTIVFYLATKINK